MTVTEHPLNFEHATASAAAAPADAEKAVRVWWLLETLYEKWKRLMAEASEVTKATMVEPRDAGNMAVSKNRISIRVDANALSIIALMLAVAAIAIVVSQSYTNPQIIDAKIQAGGADARAIANQARTDARLALEQKDQDRIRMAVLEDRLNRSK